MLHLRLITPADKTDAVVHLIENTIGTTHLVVLTGAARDPAGRCCRRCRGLSSAT